LMRILTESWNKDPEGGSRPFSADRDGFVLAEGAWVYVLEREELARERGAPIYAEVLGYGSTCDAYHRVRLDESGIEPARAMRLALEDGGVMPSDIDYINLHGTATRANDAVEDKVVYGIFGAAPAVSSTKGWTGHTLGAAGITEALIAAMCLKQGFIPGTLNCERVDPTLRSHVLRENETRPIRRVLSNIFGFGGNNCSLVLGVL